MVVCQELEQRKRTLANEVNKFSNNVVNNKESLLNSELDSKQINNNDLLVDFLKKQVDELKLQVNEEKEQKKYWQELYIKQQDELVNKIFPTLLDTQEGNKETEERVKKGFFSRLFH